MEALRRLRIPGTFPALEAAAEELAALLDEHGADGAAIYALRVVIEELGTNVMKYAYGAHHACWLELRLFVEKAVKAEEGRYVLEVEDGGEAFDPLKVAAPDLSLPLEERPIGGLGIHLVCQLMEKVEYERREGHNVLRLRRRLRGES